MLFPKKTIHKIEFIFKELGHGILAMYKITFTLKETWK